MDRTFAGSLKDWEDLAFACRANPEVKDFLSGDLDTFDEVLREARRALVRRLELEVEKRKMSQEISVLMDQAKEQASHVRLGVKLRLGLRNEHLEEFGIKPLRNRGSRNARKP